MIKLPVKSLRAAVIEELLLNDVISIKTPDLLFMEAYLSEEAKAKLDRLPTKEEFIGI